MFIAVLRLPYFPRALLGNSGVDLERLRGMLADRLHQAADRVARLQLRFDAEAEAIIERAVAIADERRRERVTVFPLLTALVEHDSSFAANLVVACGGNLSQLRARLARS